MKWDGKQYDAAKGPQAGAGMDLIAEACVKDTDCILDIGCGTGNHTVELAALASCGSVVGIDPSEEMLVQAVKKAVSVGNVSFVRTRAQDLDFNEKFDIAFSNLALHWVKEQGEAVGRVYRALKPKGRIAFQIPSKDFCPEFFEYIQGAISTIGLDGFYKEWELPWYMPSKDEYEALLERTGFKDIDVRYREHHTVFAGSNAVLDWLLMAGLRPYLAVLPEMEQEYLKYAVVMNFENNRTDKGIEIRFRRIVAFAVKA